MVDLRCRDDMADRRPYEDLDRGIPDLLLNRGREGEKRQGKGKVIDFEKCEM